jgi:hypothetical protein
VSVQHDPPPPHRRLSPDERARLTRLLDALDDALLFTPDRDRLAPFLAECRLGARAALIRCARVRPLADLLDRYGVADRAPGDVGPDEDRGDQEDADDDAPEERDAEA